MIGPLSAVGCGFCLNHAWLWQGSAFKFAIDDAGINVREGAAWALDCFGMAWYARQLCRFHVNSFRCMR